MGGAIAVRTVATSRLSFPVAGLVVIDVVEGTAMQALDHMKGLLARRPSSFRSTEEAVLWSLRAGGLHNAASARISVPSQVVEEVLGEYCACLHKSVTVVPSNVLLAVTEGQPTGRWKWRTDLQASEPYWRGWFEGLSDLFLSLRMSKLLLVRVVSFCVLECHADLPPLWTISLAS